MVGYAEEELVREGEQRGRREGVKTADKDRCWWFWSWGLPGVFLRRGRRRGELGGSGVDVSSGGEVE